MSYALNDDWDIYPDASGNLALCKPAENVLQNVATACQMWKGENLYDAEQGLPFDKLLSGTTDVTFIAGLLEETASHVEGVDYAICYPHNPVKGREMTGVLAVKIQGEPRIGYVKL